MKFGKKLCSALLVLVMVFTMLPVAPVSATEQEENPVVAVELDTITQYVGNLHTVNHPNGSFWEGYDPFYGDPVMRVIYADGSSNEFNSSDRYHFFADQEVWFELDETQADWTAGTYQVNAEYLGVAFTFEMRLCELPFQSFYVTYGGGFYEGITTEMWDEEAQAFFQGYDFWDLSPQFGLEYADGSVGGPFWNWELIDMFGSGVEIVTDQSAANPWSVGTHSVKVEYPLFGMETSFSIEVMENPIAAITAETDDHFLEGQYAYYWDEEAQKDVSYYDPSWLLIRYTVTTTSGDVIGPVDAGELRAMYGMEPNLIHDQQTNPWGVGKHEVNVEFMGATTSFEVEVKANPVKSISVADITLKNHLDKTLHEGWDEETQQDIQFWGYQPFGRNVPVTVTYADGSVETLPLHELEGYVGWSYDWRDTENWTVGQTYEATLVYNGRTANVKIKLVEDNLIGLKVSDGSVLYSSGWIDGYWDEQTQQMVSYRCYEVMPRGVRVTLTFADGTTQVLTYNDLQNSDYWYNYVDYQGPNSQWEIGQTYEIPFQMAGFTTSYKVTVVDDRVSAVAVEGELKLYEGISNYLHYIRNTGNLMVKLTRANGTVERVYLWGLINSGQEVTLDCATMDEGETLPVGKHTITLTVDGVSCQFTVEVEENTIEHIQVVLDRPLVENVTGFQEIYIDENGEEIPFFLYDINGIEQSYLVTFTDGSSKLMSRDMMYRTFGDVPYCHVDQDPENPLKLGKNTVTIYIFENAYENVLEVEKSLIVSITAKPLELLEENGGRHQWSYDEQGNETVWYYYELYRNPLELTVKFTDGSQQTVIPGWENLLGMDLNYYMAVEDGQYETHWEAGKTYTATGYLGALKFDVPVKILKNEIKKIEATATAPLVLGLHEHYMGEIHSGMFDMTKTNPIFKLTFTDGTTKSYTLQELREAYPSGEIDMIQDYYIEFPMVGKSSCDFMVLGRPLRYEFEIIENPVKSITAKPTVKLEKGYAGTEQIWNERGNDYVIADAYHFQDTMPLFTVTLTDGTVKEYLGCEALYQACGKRVMSIGYQTPDALYKVGSNEVVLWAWGHEVDYVIEIVEPANPVKKITAKAVAPLYENDTTYGYAYYYYGNVLEVTIEFADGTVISGMADKLFPTSQRAQLTYWDSQDDGEKWGVGKHTVTVEFQGVSTTCEVEVVANPYTALAIAGGETGLDLILTKADGTKETIKGTAFRALTVDDDTYVGTLTTDKGDLLIYVFMDGDSIECVEYLGLRSNRLDKGLWIKAQAAVETIGQAPKVTVGDLEEMVNGVLTEEEQALPGNRVWMTAEDITNNVPEADQAAVEQALEQLKDYEQGLVLDLNMFKIVEYGLTTEVSQLSNKITVTVALPRELCKEGVSFKVIRVHDGVAEVLDAVVDLENCTISFETDRFSTYSVAYSVPAAGEDAPPTDDSGTPIAPPADTPPTGDHMALGVMLTLMVASVLTLVVLLLKKKRA